MQGTSQTPARQSHHTPRFPDDRLRLFTSYYRPYRAVLALDLLCAVLVSAATLIFPLCAGYLTQTVLNRPPAEALRLLGWLGAFMLLLLVVQAVCNNVVDYQGHLMGTRMEHDMRRDLFAHLQRQPFSFYDRQRTGQLMSRITNDLFAVGELAHHGPEDLTVAVLKFLGAFLILLTVNAGLTLIVFCFLPVMVAYAMYASRRMNTALAESRARIADINVQVEDTLSGIRVVQSFTNEAAEQQRFDLQNRRFVDSRRAGHWSEALFSQGMTAFTQLMTVALLVFGGVAIVHARLEPGQLVTYLLYLGALIDSVQRFINIARLLQEGVTGFDRFVELMQVAPALQDRPDATELVRVRGEVEFRNVTFRYRPDSAPVLTHFDLHIRAGEFVALVGPSGAGKSTVCALIPRFYDPEEGQVLVDGVPVQQLQLQSLRRHIGVVQQEVYLFAGTVMDNIRYGNLDVPESQVIEAARLAGAHDFIEALPQGYHTELGQRGITLSGGQKQRLSLARVLVKDPPILILDEATSALDNESEQAVQHALEHLARHRTTLVIAHRLSTVRNAQRIVVLTPDGIAEQGTHDELMRAGGVYAHLQATQLRL
ncbi:ABC transporter ATP-binding protein [Deinococcus sonorensis]|uniref:ABC transporter ATP-binding protein n=2 Tax=Deinococcus sonorensis TaxID=309891 RepID=A0AAU7U8K7_9DEIO